MHALYIVMVIVGLAAGALLFSEWPKIPLGMAVGAVIAVLFMEIARVRKRLRQLEKKLFAGTIEAKPTEAATAAKPQPPEAKVAHQVPAAESAAVQPQPETPQPKPKPAEPSALWLLIRRMFMGVNTVVTIGVIILFFGVAFFLKYAVEQNMLSPEMRITSAAIAGIVMLFIGWRLRIKREGYALVLQGGGIGVLYVTMFAALKLYSMFAPGVAFAFLIAIAVFSAILAIVQNARTLAIVGIVGGFLAPILTSTGVGNHVILFSYYALLNAGIFGISWFRSWRFLNLIGFAFTFSVATYWGATRYNMELYQSTQPFLILAFLFYVGIAVLYAIRQETKLKGLVDGTLVFGTPLIVAGLQAGLMHPYPHGLSISAVGASLFYLLLAWGLFIQRRQPLRPMVESFLAIGVVFGTLAIPLELDPRVTAAFWALEGLAIFWIAQRQKRLLASIFALVLQFAAGVSFLQKISYVENAMPVLNGVYLGCMIIGLSAMAIAYLIHRQHKADSGWLAVSVVLFVWAVLWWIFGGASEIWEFVAKDYRLATGLLFFAGTALAYEFLGHRLQWSMPRYTALALLPLMVLHAVALSFYDHPSVFFGYAAWPLAFMTQYFLMYRHDKLPVRFIVQALHAATLWLLTVLVAWEVSFWINKWVQGAGTWPSIAWMLIPVVVLLYISMSRSLFRWPLAVHHQNYLVAGLAPIAVFLWGWSIVTNLTADGNPWPLPYLPLLNPLDIAQAFVCLALIKWSFALRSSNENLVREPVVKVLHGAIVALIFIWFNAILIRTFHYWVGIDLSYYAMFNSVSVQTALSVFWSLLALGTMIYANRSGSRLSWFVAAGLLAVVVLKLFLVDLSNSGTIARIVSFVGVGVLLLVIGYLTPVPPKNKTAEAKS